MIEAASLVDVWRGDFVESRHRGHVAICDKDGALRAAWGDPEAVILPRSACKMLQALPLVESSAADRLGSGELALACASHAGSAEHVRNVANWLNAAGISQGALRCGAHAPSDATERDRLRTAGATPSQLHNNCSGKHAGFLTLNASLGGEPDYIDPDHPVQVAVREALEDMTGAESPGIGVDGCSAPNFATSVRGLARAMARFADPRGLAPSRGAAATRLQEAMRAHPRMVAGDGHACTQLMIAANGAAALKWGADGVFAGILPSAGLGIAIKIEDGARRAIDCAATAILVRLNVVDRRDPQVMERLNAPVQNWRNVTCGRVSPSSDLWGEGGSL